MTHIPQVGLNSNVIKMIVSIFCWVLFNQNVTCQNTWMDYSKKANEKIDLKEYKSAVIYFEQSFKYGNNQAVDFYNAACAYSLLNDSDSAFSKIYRAVALGFDDIKFYEHDSDLINIKSSNKWIDMIDFIKERKNENEVKYGSVKKKLEAILESDQKIRTYLTDTIYKKYGSSSREADSTFYEMKKNDSINLLAIDSIVEKYGWLGSSQVGNDASMVIFLVIQHSELAVQEKYLPKMRAAVLEGRSFPQYLALLEDRINFYKNKKQIYGSQVIRDKATGNYKLYPIKNEKNVNKRRLAVGLPSLEDYLSTFGIKYNPL